MDDGIVQAPEGATLVGAAEASAKDIAEALAFAPILVAADGGARHVLAAGRTPLRVIGDMDSIDARSLVGLDPATLPRIADQDTTDFEKCLMAVSAPVLLAVGFAGGRMDHQAAVMNALVRHPGRRCIVLGAADLCFHCPPALTLELPVGTALSLFPMAEMRGRGEGLHWPPGDITFAPWGRVGTSNRTAAPRVSLEFAAPGMLVFLPRAHLPEAVRALRSAPPHPG